MKNKPAVRRLSIALLLLIPACVHAQPPSTLPFPQGGQFRLSISNSDPNMIFVPGDRITAITALGGMLADKRNTSAGGVLFTSVAKKPFTLFVETARGQAFSVVAMPVKGEGKVYRLMSEEPPKRPEARQWEMAQTYEKLLISLTTAMLKGEILDGYGEVAPLSDGVQVPGGMTLTPVKAWAGDQLRIDRFQLRNANTWGVSLREQDFWKPGVRAVTFDSNAQTLLGGGSLMITVIRSGGEGRDGESE